MLLVSNVALFFFYYIFHYYNTNDKTLFFCLHACITATSYQELPLHHPLRYFLKMFVYRTVKVNYAGSNSLLPKNLFVHRTFAFDFENYLRFFFVFYFYFFFAVWVCVFVFCFLGLQKRDKFKIQNIQTKLKKNKKNRSLRYSNHGYQFTLFPDRIDESMRKEDDYSYPLLKDSNDYWQIVKVYVTQFLDIFYPNGTEDIFGNYAKNISADGDIVKFCEKISLMLGIQSIKNKERFIDVISTLICNGTAYHEHVG